MDGQYTDMPEENRADIVEIVTGAIDRSGSDYDVSAPIIHSHYVWKYFHAAFTTPLF